MFPVFVFGAHVGILQKIEMQYLFFILNLLTNRKYCTLMAEFDVKWLCILSGRTHILIKVTQIHLHLYFCCHG